MTPPAIRAATPCVSPRPLKSAPVRAVSSDALPAARAAVEKAAERAERGMAPWALFDQRVQTHHDAVGRGGGASLSSEQAAKRLAAQLQRPRTGQPRAVYLHVPFCRKICSFCAFNRQGGMTAALCSAYAAALEREVERLGGTRWAEAAPIDAVYVGGGTPTTLSAAELAGVIRRLRALFWIDDDCEVTVETRCCDVSAGYLETLRAAGVNRLSFGVQSFDTTVRQDVGRVADQRGVLAALDTARQAGFAQISVDLIYNLPRETAQSWERDFELLAASSVTAASVYALIAFERSALQQRIARGSHPPLGGLAVQFERFMTASQALGQRRYWRRQSCVHFGDQRCEQSRYNGMRSQNADVLGIGAGAGGQVGSVRYMNPCDVDAFAQRAAGDAMPRIMASELPDRLTQLKRVFALSESGSIDLCEFAKLLPSGVPLVQALQRAGLAEQVGDALCLTDAGCFWAYNIGAALAELVREDNKEFPCDRS
jgi:oxygen-independent coproporphyrinogen-3 oxidase